MRVPSFPLSKTSCLLFINKYLSFALQSQSRFPHHHPPTIERNITLLALSGTLIAIWICNGILDGSVSFVAVWVCDGIFSSGVTLIAVWVCNSVFDGSISFVAIWIRYGVLDGSISLCICRRYQYYAQREAEGGISLLKGAARTDAPKRRVVKREKRMVNVLERFLLNLILFFNPPEGHSLNRRMVEEILCLRSTLHPIIQKSDRR